MAKNTDSLSHTIKMVLGVSLACSIVVSVAAVGLRPIQQDNKLQDKQKNILAVSGVEATGKTSELFNKYIETRIVDLATGDFVTDGSIDPATYDQRLAAKDPAMNVTIAPEDDAAGIARRAKYAAVYLVKNDAGEVQRLILPVHGRGLWSTMYAFIAVAPDGNTIEGITYYDQGETPGLGGEVENPTWRKQFVGKQLIDDAGQPAITIVKGGADKSSPYQVDGLSGATLTANGVQGTFNYWFSENAFGPFLAKIRNGGLNNG